MAITCSISVMMSSGSKVISSSSAEKKNEDCNIYVVPTSLHSPTGKPIKKFTNFPPKTNYLFNKINHYMYLILYIKRSNSASLH